MNGKLRATKRSITLSLAAGAFLLGGLFGVSSLANAQTLRSSSPVVAESPTPVTYVTEINRDEIVMQITEGDFRFHGYLERTSGNTFVGHDDQVRVIYDRDTSRVVVINIVTGDEYYNYFFSTADEGSL